MPEYPIPQSDRILKLLRERLPDKTYNHVLSVADTMVDMTEQAGITPEQAASAGLLHDLCKAFKAEELRVRAERFGISDFLDTPNLLHGPVAAREAELELGIDDPDVLDAVHWHTTGRPDWSAVGLALYLADFSEPLRSHPQAVVARGIRADEGFIPAVRYAVEQKTENVRKRHGNSPLTEAFADWFARTYPA